MKKKQVKEPIQLNAATIEAIAEAVYKKMKKPVTIFPKEIMLEPGYLKPLYNSAS